MRANKNHVMHLNMVAKINFDYILSEYCGEIGPYLDAEGIEYTCPDGIKEIKYHQPVHSILF